MKKIWKRTVALLLVMLLGMTSFGGFGMTASAADPVLVNLSIGNETLTLWKGETVLLSAIAVYSDYSSKELTSGVSWSSSDNSVVSASGTGAITAVKKTEQDSPVTITASYAEGGVSLEASCKVTVIKTDPIDPDLVSRIDWTWEANALVADPSWTYSFAYEDGRYSVIPETAAVKTATLTCAPADALEINNEAKTFKVNPLKDKERLEVTLTLTADGAGGNCLPATKTMTIYKDDPVLRFQGVVWDFPNGGREPFFGYDDTTDPKKVAVYYFMPTDLGNPNAPYMFKLVPELYNRHIKTVLDNCELSVTSSDKRVIVIDMPTGRIIPVGKGKTDLTVTLTAPDGKVCSDTVTATVCDSPYTPITSVRIVPTEASILCEAGEDETPELSAVYGHNYLLTAELNDGATLLNQPIDAMMNDGRILRLVKKCDFRWTSDNEDVVEVETKSDGTASIRVTGFGDATVTLTVNDSGEEFVSSVRVHARMTWQEALIGFFGSLFFARWSKIPMYAKAFWYAMKDAVGGSHC